MLTTGIICEYNPFHLGHKKQIDAVRQAFPEDGIVCLMSGNYVQRGAPAIVDKTYRAKAAVLSGADLVLEMPVTVSLCSAEGFAAGCVNILADFCHKLCFGAEDPDKLKALVDALHSKAFTAALKPELEKGLSFPAARQSALDAMGLDGSLLAKPNNILAVEYCKALRNKKTAMQPYAVLRQGNYHETNADPENPSATAVRKLMRAGGDWQACVPEAARECFMCAPLHHLANGEKAILYRLRTMTDAEFEALPYGSEGLWRKLMHSARSYATLEDIIGATKSKRYTRTRIDRMILCAFLGITEQMLNTPAPYVRVLAFNDKGRQILKEARQTGEFLNIGQLTDHPYQNLENRCGDLYGLFAADPEVPGNEDDYRVFCQK